MKIISSAFSHNQPIPAKYTCDGNGTNPPLTFSEVSAAAQSLAVVMDDPDAPMGTWDHWVVFNIPPDTTDISENTVPKGIVGKNTRGKNEYQGPCPPDRQHRYFFKLYALDTTLLLDTSATKQDLEKAMEGHILAKSELIGLYDKR